MLHKHLNETQTVGRTLSISINCRFSAFLASIYTVPESAAPNFWSGPLCDSAAFLNTFSANAPKQNTTSACFVTNEQPLLVSPKPGLFYLKCPRKWVEHNSPGPEGLHIKSGIHTVLFFSSFVIARLPMPSTPRLVPCNPRRRILVMRFVNRRARVGIVRAVL